MRLNSFGVTLAVLVGGGAALEQWHKAAADNDIPGIQAHLRATSQHVPINHPIWVQFSIENMSDEPVTLTVPGSEPAIPSPEMGLPLAHVFSGGGTSRVPGTPGPGRPSGPPPAH